MEQHRLAAFPRDRPQALVTHCRRRFEDEGVAGVGPLRLDHVFREAFERHQVLRNRHLSRVLVHADHVEPAAPGAGLVASVTREYNEAAIGGPPRPAGLVAVLADLPRAAAVRRHQPDVVGRFVGVEHDPPAVGRPVHSLVFGIGPPHDALGSPMGRFDAGRDRSEMLGDVRVMDVVRHVPPAPEGERDVAAVGAPGRRLRLERGQGCGRSALRCGGGEKDPVVLALENDFPSGAHRRRIGVPGETGQPRSRSAAHAPHPQVEEPAVPRHSMEHPLPVGRERDPSVRFLILEERLRRRAGEVQSLAISDPDQAGDPAVGGPRGERETFSPGQGVRLPTRLVEYPERRDAAGAGHPRDGGAVRRPDELGESSRGRLGVGRPIRPEGAAAAVSAVVDPPLPATPVEDVLVNEDAAAVREPGEIADRGGARPDPPGRASGGGSESDLAPFEGGEPRPVR